MNVDDTDVATVSPLDALLVINELTSRSVIDAQGRLPENRPAGEMPRYIDVNDDGFVSPVDALLVINELTRASNWNEAVDSELAQFLSIDPDREVGDDPVAALEYQGVTEAEVIGDAAVTSPAIAATSDGGSVVVWVEEEADCEECDGPSYAIVTQRYAADGTKMDDAERVAMIGNAQKIGTEPIRSLDVDVNEDDEVVVVWSQFNGTDWDVYLKQPAEAPIMVHEATAGSQRSAAVAVGQGDDLLVVWQDDDLRRLQGRYFGSFESGEITLEPDGVSSEDTDPRVFPDVVTAVDGYFISWTVRSGDGQRVDGAYLDPGGQILTSFSISHADDPAVDASASSVASSVDGSYVAIAWQQRSVDEVGWSTHIRGYDLTNGDTPDAFLVANSASYGTGTRPTVAVDSVESDGSLSLLAGWNGNGIGDIDGQYVRRYDFETAAWAASEALLGQSDTRPIIASGKGDMHVAQLDADKQVSVQALGNHAGVSNPASSTDDLVSFAQALAASGTTFYGAAWCEECTRQKELFDDGGQFLPFVEVTNPDQSLNEVGQNADVSTYPTWEFPDGSRLEGVQSLETLSERAGVNIPTSDTPFLAPIDDQTLLVGSPLHISLDGYDPKGSDLSFTVASDNPDVSAVVLSANRSIRLDVDGFGDLVFELFEQRAPRATSRIIELSEDNFYDGIIFHRVVNNFVIQTGDPNGTGSGGSQLGDFDDQFHVDLQHNRTGLLSMAKASDDTNDSQLFVTEGPSRHLDFNHTIFGLLVEGESNRAAISDTETVGNRPLNSITIGSTEVFDDSENGVVMLKAADGAVGTATITITATNADNRTFQTSFVVTLDDDTANGGPFLKDFDDQLQTTAGVPIQFTLDAIDVEHDDFTFGMNADNVAGQLLVELNEATGEITVTPVEGFTGMARFVVGVRPSDTSNTGDVWDAQSVTVDVLEGP